MNTKPDEMQAEYDFSNARRGLIAPPALDKTQVILRLDTDILDWFRAQAEDAAGGNYQDAINIALREYMLRNHGELLETILRRVIREEMKTAA
jgi:uncharacterized protein (DUF4415 family)